MLGGGLEYTCFVEVSLYSKMQIKLSRIGNKIPDIITFKYIIME